MYRHGLSSVKAGMTGRDSGPTATWGPPPAVPGSRVTATAKRVLRLNFFDGLCFCFSPAGISRFFEREFSEPASFSLSAWSPWRTGAASKLSGAFAVTREESGSVSVVGPSRLVQIGQDLFDFQRHPQFSKKSERLL
jgi:hypothetical protein